MSCRCVGTKVIFWDMRETFIDGLYKGSVTQARMEKVVNALDPVSSPNLLVHTFVGPRFCITSGQMLT